MKIKKVEIQAFRAYDKVEDGTFDFTSDRGNVANFVTLYAPNGFGKTSFYDAVEWGVTNNISRFLRKKTENKNAAKAEKNRYIWRHNNSNEDTPSFVKISTDDSRKTFYRTLCHKLKSNQRDAKFDEKLTEESNKYFLDVMLSQEHISSFLKEDDASLRYEKFTSTFGDQKIDKNYKHITELINFNKKKIKNIKDRTKELKELLSKDVDRNILNTINSIINEVNKLGGKLPNINYSYSDKDDSELKIKIINLMNTCQNEINSLNEIIKRIDNFISPENKETIVEFEKINIKLTSIEDQINKNKVFLSDLEKKKTKERRLNSEVKELDNLKEFSHKISDLALNIKEIEDIKTSLSRLRIDLEQLNIQQKSIQSDLHKAERRTREEQARNDSLQSVKNELIYRLENSVLEYKLNDARLNEIELLTEDIKVKKNKAEDLKLEKLKLNDFLESTQQRLAEFKSNSFNRKLLEQYPNLENEFTFAVVTFDQMADLNKALTSVESELEESQALDSDIKNLVKSGASLVSKNSLSNCPLCSTEYSDFNKLLNAIESNLLFDKRLKFLLSQKNAIQIKYKETKDKFESAKKFILSFLSDAIDTYQVNISKTEASRIETIKIKQNIESKLKSIQSVVNNFTRETESKNLFEYEDILNERIDKIEVDITESMLTISKSKELLNTLLSQIKVNQVNIDLVSENIKILSKRPVILHALELLGSKDISKVSATSITNMNDKVISDLSDKQSVIEKLQNEINEINVKHGKREHLEVEDEIQNLKNKRTHISNKIKVIRHFIEDELKIDINDSNSSQLFNLILNKKRNLHTMLDTKMNAISMISSIDQYREKVIPFLKHSEYFDEYSSLTKEENFLVNFVGKELDKERKSIALYIEEEVQSFFFQDLINKFYKKIDPHPQYKEISFKCDFSADKPKLHVLVASEDRQIVPTLYFSSAQLNALSLSIFLAKAINVKNPDSDTDVNSIFVDDPIQAMDSINILSVIDLLRSITINFNKQIILSTHDENFFELLKRKVPRNIFESKFIELESYGKVGKKVDFSNAF
ncbi:AAA family ATPase [Vibrio parahaemolyticus]|uniref:AAA family ATPase n=1 Tax=Vibrio parahaemolyticus TaxID=670 RepID=UPI0032992451